MPQRRFDCNSLGKWGQAVQNRGMTEEKAKTARPQRTLDRRKRQAAALKANLKRRKLPAETARLQKEDAPKPETPGYSPKD
jgi:hypothetical protein